MFETLQNIDERWLLLINQHYSPVLDYLMIFSTGTLSWLPLYILLLYLIIRKFRMKAILILLMVALTVTLTDQLSVHLFKEVFLRLRPCHHPDLQDSIRTIIGCGGKYGFVSSHAANSVGLVTFLLLVFRPMNMILALFLIVYVLLNMVSRVYLGVHYPFDVLGGAFLGIICGLTTSHLTKFLISKF